jgi:hypothetical protein
LRVGGFSGANAGDGTQLVFTDFEAAQQVVHWLSASQAAVIGAQTLSLDPPCGSLEEARKHKDYPRVQLKRVADYGVSP